MLINASGFSECCLQNHLPIYHSHAKKLAVIHHFSDALKPSTWVDNFTAFAYVIHDVKTGDVALVRDHLGLQPLYYYHRFGKLIFGESIPDILKHIEDKKSFNEQELIYLRISIVIQMKHFISIFIVLSQVILFIFSRTVICIKKRFGN